MTDANGRMSVADFEALFAEIDNSGRWGADDSRGTLNLLQPSHVVAAAATVRTGRTVTLSLPLNTVAGPDNPSPAVHYMAIGHEDADHPINSLRSERLGVEDFTTFV